MTARAPVDARVIRMDDPQTVQRFGVCFGAGAGLGLAWFGFAVVDGVAGLPAGAAAGFVAGFDFGFGVGLFMGVFAIARARTPCPVGRDASP